MRFRGRGFTLLEVLIAVAIVATIAVLGYRAVAALSDSESRLSAEASRWRALDGFFARLEGDMREAVPRGARLGTMREAAWLGNFSDDRGNAALSFSRAGPEFNLEPGSGGQRLQYRFRAGTVEVLYWAGYDRVPTVAPIAYPLLTDVAGFRLAYLTKDGSWSSTWPITGETELPRAARALLTLANGEVIERWMALR